MELSSNNDPTGQSREFLGTIIFLFEMVSDRVY